MQQFSRTGYGLSANQLKLIAVAAMVIDHSTALLFFSLPEAWLLRMIGRMTAPIMCFFIAEGFAHTSSLPRYLGRLFLAAVVSHVPFLLCHGGLREFWRTSSVMWTLFLGLVALAFAAERRFPLWLKLVVVLGCCALAWRSDWSWYAILWILGFGLFREERGRAFAVFIAVGLLYAAQGFAAPSLFTVSRFGVFLVLPLLLCYHGRHGTYSRVLQYGFYWFYPAHLLVLWGISQCLVF